jgi:SAM-dependent methyltransferase
MSDPRQPQKPEPPMRAQDYAAVRDWPGYFAAVLGKPARETLIAALDSFEKEGRAPGFAVDVGAGEGRDTLELLKRGWRVLATDGDSRAFEHLWARVPESQKSLLTTEEAQYAQMAIPACDLVNASFALPFCEPRDFPALWKKIGAAIRPGGRFAGQLFGDRDSWASLPDRTHHSRAAAEALFGGFEFEMFKEEEKDETGEVRNPKHWQVFHIVARKGRG